MRMFAGPSKIYERSLPTEVKVYNSNARKKHCKVKAYNSKCFPLNGVSLYLEFGGGGAGLDSGRTQVAPSGLLGLS